MVPEICIGESPDLYTLVVRGWMSDVGGRVYVVEGWLPVVGDSVSLDSGTISC